MFDVVISIAGIRSHNEPNTSYVGTQIFRADLEDEPDAVEDFMKYIKNYPGIVHAEKLRGEVL